MNKKELEYKKWCVSRAIQHAESVLHVFEEEYPEDDRPRKAIEAAKAWLENPSEENQELADAAAAAADAADTADAAAYAAYAAADATTTFAAYATTFAAAAAARQKEKALQAKKREELGL